MDKIPTCLLKDAATIIAPALTHIVNMSLISGIVPSDFKCGPIVPIYKSGPQNNIDNYRPITILPTVSEILEKCVHSQLMKYLEDNKFLSLNSFGFCSKRSTELATVLFVDNIRKAMDKGEMTGAVYIDLSKAFDTIGYTAILTKLEEYGVRTV